ncbi:MAG: hypothetical protein JHC33_15150 [Ignisphaera sp.]|nr:hypothetical protein [Ignisphaera sp.]
MNLNPLKLVKKLIYRALLSELSRTLIKSWSEAGSEWQYDSYRLTHKQSKVQLWIGNGRWHFNVCKEGSNTDFDGNIPIGYLERHILWHEYSSIMKATKKAKIKKVHADLLAKIVPSVDPILDPIINETGSPTPAPPRVRKPTVRKTP